MTMQLQETAREARREEVRARAEAAPAPAEERADLLGDAYDLLTEAEGLIRRAAGGTRNRSTEDWELVRGIFDLNGAVLRAYLATNDGIRNGG